MSGTAAERGEGYQRFSDRRQLIRVVLPPAKRFCYVAFTRSTNLIPFQSEVISASAETRESKFMDSHAQAERAML